MPLPNEGFARHPWPVSNEVDSGQKLAKVAKSQMYGLKAVIHFEDRTAKVGHDLFEHESYVGGLRRTM